MSFSSFPTHYATNISTNPVGQFATSKFTPNIPQFISAPDGSLHYVRNESNTFVAPNIPQQGTTNEQQIQPLLTIPITVPGAKPGDAQQIVHIQVLNPNINITPVHQVPSKYQMGPMQLPVQNQQPTGTTVLTVAYSPQDNKFLTNHAFPENMTVVAAVQPQDLHLLAQAQIAQTPTNKPMDQPALHSNEQYSESITIKQEPSNEWENVTVAPTNQTNNGNFQQQQNNNNCTTQSSSVPLNLQPYLKFNSTPVKFESVEQTPEEPVKPKRKRKTKKKPPKEKTPKPGQVLIAKASDGTTLFCCPECQMAYPEKENLEQHLTEHKIERRYICDICGAGLKRKEHLERHKSGHNPDRPYICSICLKGFKRKEHLNLHFVIHSGEKNEICGECGKGFYRKDHLRKHANSHAAKRIKEELNAKSISSLSDIELTIQNQINSAPEIVTDNNNCSISISLDVDMSDKQTDTQTITLPH
ncbi:zinc finger protein 467-like [Eupeodes corollae]|uniref:zinc finger protein 467-like n=1 Tax=Eupeodes corollae TaxID=290404 RepID=UPI00248FA976|nr:zinc finger protein 467-like [Eupeodes corollae]XP_055912497.1 zinc finger protein 467-like [Eupeodes corollae]